MRNARLIARCDKPGVKRSSTVKVRLVLEFAIGRCGADGAMDLRVRAAWRFAEGVAERALLALWLWGEGAIAMVAMHLGAQRAAQMSSNA